MTAPGPTEKPDPGFSRIFPGFPGTFDWELKSDAASTNRTPETNRQIGNLYSPVASPKFLATPRSQEFQPLTELVPPSKMLHKEVDPQ